MLPHLHSCLFFFLNLVKLDFLPADPVPEKPLSANRGLNLPNSGLKFNRGLDCVPQGSLSAKMGLIGGVIDLAISINSAPIGD